MTKSTSIAAEGLALNRSIIKRERLRSGLSQGEVAKRLDIERSYVTSLETGRKQPSYALLERIAELWHMPPHDLVTTKDAAETLAKIGA